MTNCKRENIHLISGVCYFISSKLKEVNNFSLDFLKTGIFKDKFEKIALVKVEVKILKKINFRVKKPTILNFIEIYLEIAKKHLNKEKLDILSKINFFISLMSLLVEELIFDIPPYEAALINFLCSLNLIKQQFNNIYSPFEIRNIKKSITLFFNSLNIDKKHNDEISNLENISKSLLISILHEMTLTKRNFFEIYFQIVSKNEN